MMDVNVNRGAEGLRVLEDHCRYSSDLTAEALWIKQLRRRFRALAQPFEAALFQCRQATDDPGPGFSVEMERSTAHLKGDVITVNIKRVQEAARALEEYCKSLGKIELSQGYEALRFEMYTIEKAIWTKDSKRRKTQMMKSGIYGITAEEWSLGRGNVEVVKAMLDGGVKIVQYRDKDKTLLEKYRDCVEIRDLTSARDALFIVNDHPEIAVAVEADGVHAGQDDLPISALRKTIGQQMLIGVSTHCPEQGHEAVEKGADYLGIGPIFSTKTKKNVCAPVGLRYLNYAAENFSIPFVAIGGIKRHNLEAVMENGGSCIALVTEIVGAEDIASRVREVSERMVCHIKNMKSGGEAHGSF